MNKNQREVFHIVTTDGEHPHRIAGTYSTQENAVESFHALKRINPKVAALAYIAQSIVPEGFICDDDIEDEDDIFEAVDGEGE